MTFLLGTSDASDACWLEPALLILPQRSGPEAEMDKRSLVARLEDPLLDLDSFVDFLVHRLHERVEVVHSLQLQGAQLGRAVAKEGRVRLTYPIISGTRWGTIRLTFTLT